MFSFRQLDDINKKENNCSIYCSLLFLCVLFLFAYVMSDYKFKFSNSADFWLKEAQPRFEPKMNIPVYLNFVVLQCVLRYLGIFN